MRPHQMHDGLTAAEIEAELGKLAPQSRDKAGLTRALQMIRRKQVNAELRMIGKVKPGWFRMAWRGGRGEA